MKALKLYMEGDSAEFDTVQKAFLHDSFRYRLLHGAAAGRVWTEGLYI